MPDKVLKKLFDKLAGIEMAVIGTSDMQLQGIAIEPNDFDLATDDKGITEIAQIFSSQITDLDGYKETIIFIDGYEFHFVSVTTNPLRNDDFRRPIWIKKNGLTIPCMPLESESKFYSQLNTKKAQIKVDLIRNRLK